MKKIFMFAIFATTLTLSSCGNKKASTEVVTTTTETVVDSVKSDSVLVDSTTVETKTDTIE